MVQVLVLVTIFIFPLLNAGTSSAGFILILLSAAGMALMYLLGLEKFKMPLRLRKIFLIHLLIILWMVMTTINSAAISYSMTELRLQMAMFAFVWLGVPIWSERRSRWSILAAVSIGATILCLISIWLLFWPFKFLGGSDINFFYPVYGHNRLAEYLLLSLPVTGYLLQQKQKTKIFLGCLVIQVVGLVLCFSRASLFLAGLVPVIVYVLSDGQSKKKIKPVVILGSFVMLTILLLVPFWHKSDVNIKRSTELSIAKVIDKPLYIDERLKYFIAAISGIVKKPIFGYGPATYQYTPSNYLARPNGVTNYTHNFFLQVAYENGIPVVILYLVIIVGLVVVATKDKRIRSDGRLFLIVGVLLSLVHAQMDFDWQIPAVYLLAMIILIGLASDLTAQVDDRGVYWRLIIVSIIPLILGVVNINPEYNSGDGKLYLNQFENFIGRSDFQLAATSLIKARGAIVNNNLVDEEKTQAVLKGYVDGQVNDETALELVNILDRGYSPHDLYWLKNQSLVFEVLDKLMASGINNSRIEYLKFTENLITDKRQFSQYEPYLIAAVEGDPMNNDLKIYLEMNRALVSKDPGRIEKTLGKVSQGPQSETARYLASYLVEAMAGTDTGLLQNALDLSPGYGSMYVNLAFVYRSNGDETKAEKTIGKCTIKFPECRSWYEDLITKRKN